MPKVNIEGDLNGCFTVNGVDFSRLTVENWQAVLATLTAPIYQPMDGWVPVGRGSEPWLLRVAHKTFDNVRDIIDCQTMYSTANAGHGNMDILLPVALQTLHESGARTGNALPNILQLPAFFALTGLVGGGYRVMTKLGGGEAVETAIKLARTFFWALHGEPAEEHMGHGPYLVVAKSCFHGRPLGVTSTFERGDPSRDGFGPFADATIWVPFNDIGALYNVLHTRTDIAAVLLEPIQGEGGINIPDDDYLPKVAALCREHGVLFILDEVQTGFGRTGKNFAFEHHDGLKPDILALGKALGGGALSASATLARTDVSFDGGKTTHDLFSYFGPGREGQTWLGADTVCMAILASIKELCDKDHAALAAENGARFIAELKELQEKYPRLITDVRGKGLMVGADFTIPGRTLSHALLDEGVWAYYTGPEKKTLRFLPPLVTPPEVLSEVVVRLERALLRLLR